MRCSLIVVVVFVVVVVVCRLFRGCGSALLWFLDGFLVKSTTDNLEEDDVGFFGSEEGTGH